MRKHVHVVLPRGPLPAGMTGLPFSDAVRAGDTLYVAGRLGLDPATARPPETVEAEARLLMDDLLAVLRAGGMTSADLVMVTVFAPDIAHFRAFNAVYARYFDGPLPARAFIGSGPLLFGCRFELTAIAVAHEAHAAGAPAAPPFQTVDLVDAHQDRVQTCTLQLVQFGARRRFSGRIRTVRTFEDNALLREVLGTPGNGDVMVVDGGGSLHAALVGDLIAQLAIDNGWSGLVMNAAIRDVERLATMPLGIKALGSNPMKSTKQRTGEVGVPVHFGDMTFTPGEMLYADDDGVLVSAVPLV
jgi:regulator of ribonuclease activity A